MRLGYLAFNTGAVVGHSILDSTQAMEVTGGNTGNLAFWYAGSKLTNAKLIMFNRATSPDLLKGKVDALMFPASNFLNEDLDLTKLAHLVRELNVPCFIVGLGAQSESFDYIPKLKSGTVNFIREVSKRTPYLCVRGEFTKKVCEYYGVTNVISLGCPSVFINKETSLGVVLENKFNKPIESLSVHAACRKESLKGVERDLTKQLGLYGGKYIIQRPPEFIKLMNSENLSVEDVGALDVYREFFFPGYTHSQMHMFFKKKGAYYLDISTWINSLRACSHGIGTRIHGTMLTLAAEVPSICITHDTRTSELADALKIPRISSIDYQKSQSNIRDVMNRAIFSGEEFDNNRRVLAIKYDEILNQLEIPVGEILRPHI